MSNAHAEWAALTGFVGLFAATGFLAGEHAQSLLLVGEPGVGKSALLRRFQNVSTARLIMDCTSDGLRHHLLPDAERAGIKHFIFPEFFKLFQRRPETVANTVGILTLMMTGELHDQFIGNTDPVRFAPNLQVGVLAGMPTQVFKQWARDLSNTGVMSRMAVVKVEFSERQKLAIELALAKGDTQYIQPVTWRWPEINTVVGFRNDRDADALLRLVAMVQAKGERNRLISTMRTLLKAAAALNGHKEVTAMEFAQLRALIPLFRNMRV